MVIFLLAFLFMQTAVTFSSKKEFRSDILIFVFSVQHNCCFEWVIEVRMNLFQDYWQSPSPHLAAKMLNPRPHLWRILRTYPKSCIITCDDIKTFFMFENWKPLFASSLWHVTNHILTNWMEQHLHNICLFCCISYWIVLCLTSKYGVLIALVCVLQLD